MRNLTEAQISDYLERGVLVARYKHGATIGILHACNNRESVSELLKALPLPSPTVGFRRVETLGDAMACAGEVLK